MVAENQDLALTAGDDATVRAQIDPRGDIDTLSGATIRWVIADEYGGSTVVTKTTGSGITITNEDALTFEVAIDGSDTSGLDGPYVHEGEVTAGGETVTVTRGPVTIDADTA